MLVIAHKVVSKAEGRIRALADVVPGERAIAARGASSARTRGTCRWCSTSTRESLRAERGVLICETHHGFVCANAGVDASNAPATTRS